MSEHRELSALLRTAYQLSKLCEQGAGLVAEARDHHADTAVMAAARKMASDLLRTKHSTASAAAGGCIGFRATGPR